MISQKDICEQVTEFLLVIHNSKRCLDDLPMIRECLNNAMDVAERAGILSRRVSDRWSQDRMVKAVQRGIRKAIKA